MSSNIKYPIIIVFMLICIKISAQEYHWKVGLDYFFDNTEYKKSSFIDSETMNGIWLSPIGSVVFNERHSVNAGAYLLKIPGMDKIVDKAELSMYYQYKSRNVLFKAGAFPRNEVLGNYNNFFFKDSVNNFIPLVQGVFWQIGNERNFFNAWFDRTGYATPTKHEHFFVGLSGQWSKGLFFADFQSYMFHNSNTRPATTGDGVSENLQLQTTAGVRHNSENGFSGLIAAGALLGYERDRRFDNTLYKPVGFVARADAEMWGIGTANTFYVGDERMRLSDTFGGDLYWGTQFLRAKSYLKSEWYIHLINADWVKARFNCNLHFTQGNVLFQQMLNVSVTMDNFSHKRQGEIYPWMKFFK